MAEKSSIEWTESTWNPVTGCTKISPGCMNCYAERMAKRLQAMGQANYKNGFNLTIHPQNSRLPLKWNGNQTIFVNSMSDLFHEAIPIEFVQEVFETMEEASWHRFQVLTKRSERLLEISPLLKWVKNIWMGVSVENEKYMHRIDHLRETPAHVKFLSIEPLLGPLNNMDLSDIDWVIVGGESGPGARPMKKEWVMDIRDQCIKAKIPFFFKQWGGMNKKKAGRSLEGRTWDEMPLAIAV
ncbi:MAG: phage Gp37/Gp68 family protein [Acidobacteria bacterium]|jgi:protein gp37|nr:phage Gp37/Gp68 family protein [Acidobacteriota bacterium]